MSASNTSDADGLIGWRVTFGVDDGGDLFTSRLFATQQEAEAFALALEAGMELVTTHVLESCPCKIDFDDADDVHSSDCPLSVGKTA